MDSFASRKQKVFIVGVSGLLGYHLARRLQPDFLISGAYFDHRVFIPDAQLYPISLQSMEVLETIVRTQAPDILINCMSVTDRRVVLEQAKLADNINVLFPVSLAILASKIKAQFIQICCADVYEGSKGNYSEEDNQY